MQYSKRDLRAARALGVFLVAVGLLSLLAAGIVFFQHFFIAEDATPSLLRKTGVWPLLMPCVIFLSLGTAVSLKVRSLAQAGGHEPEDFPGVPGE